MNFKTFIMGHNPYLKWNFNDPAGIKRLFIDGIRNSGDADMKTLYDMFKNYGSTGLTKEQEILMEKGFKPAVRQSVAAKKFETEEPKQENLLLE